MGKKERLNAAYTCLRNRGKWHTQKELAAIMSADPSNVSKAIRGEPSALTDSFLRRFVEATGDVVSLSWLLTGEGPMLNEGGARGNVVTVRGSGNTTMQTNGDNNSHTTTNNYYTECDETASREPMEAMTDRIATLEGEPRVSYSQGRPYYNVDFMAGFDLLVNDQTATPEYLIDFVPFNRDGVAWCNISGQSMEPKISHGDIIAIREVSDWRAFLSFGEIYAVVTANDLRTVKIIRRGADDDHYRLVPLNLRDYDEQQIPTAQIVRIYAVLAVIKKL